MKQLRSVFPFLACLSLVVLGIAVLHYNGVLDFQVKVGEGDGKLLIYRP